MENLITIKSKRSYWLSTFFKIFIFAFLMVLPRFAFPADYYWVSGATGNDWSNLARWRTTSGGAITHAVLPGSADNVFFDANSFLAGTTVNIDVASAICNNMNWTGAANTPQLTGTGTIEIHGNLTLIAGMTQAFTGNLLFKGSAAGRTITTAGHTFADIAFNGTGGWVVQDNLSVTNSLFLEEGTLNTNGRPVSCGFLNAFSGTDAVRALVLGASAVTITGTVADFRGDSPNFTLNAGTSVLTFTNSSSNINVRTGTQSKTLPKMVFANSASPFAININSPGTSRITFGDITVAQNNATLNLMGGALKTFGKIQLANANTAVVEGNATAPAATDNVFNGTIDAGANSTVTFKGAGTYNANITFANSTTAGNVTFERGSVFATAVLLSLGDRTTASFEGTADVYTLGRLTAGANANVTFSNTGNNTFNNSIITGSNTSVAFSNGGTNTFQETVSIGTSNLVSFTNTGLNTFNKAVSVSAGSTWRFTSLNNSNVNSNFIVSAACGSAVNINSSGATQAAVKFGVANNWSNANVSDLDNSTGVTATVSSGSVNNSVNINFTAGPATGRNLYWVGGTGNWNDTGHWSLTSGGAGGECIPTIIDNVYFDNASFSALNQVVTVNIAAAYCKNMDWSGSTARTPRFATSSSANDLYISGSVVFNTGMTQLFAGDVYMVSTQAETITMAGQALWNVNFARVGGQWTFQDAFTSNANIRIAGGSVITNNQNVTCFRLDANLGDSIRALNLGSSAVEITGGTNSLDLTGNTGNFTFNPGTSVVTLSRAGDVVVTTGTFSKTIPNLIISNATTGHTITLNTGFGANRITFRNITVLQDGAVFAVNGTSPKTYGAISMPNSMNATFNGTNAASPNNNIFTGVVTFGNNTQATFNHNNSFNANVTFGTNTARAHFTGVVNFPNAGTMLSFGSNSTDVVFSSMSGTVNNIFQNVTVAAGSHVRFSNNGTNKFANVTVNGTSTWLFSNFGLSTINGDFIPASLCPNVVNIGSHTPGANAPITFPNNPQTWTDVVVTDISVVGGQPVTVISSSVSAGSTGISYTATVRTLYWVGGSGNWNDGAHWSLTSGGAGGTCPPTINDDVFFDANSFPAAGATVTIDAEAYCRSMDWTGASNMPSLGGTSAFNLNMAGNITLIPNMNITFEGKAILTPISATVIPARTITSAGRKFMDVDFADFNTPPGTWTLQDDFALASDTSVINLQGGTLVANGRNISTGFFNANFQSPLYGAVPVQDKPRTLDLSTGTPVVSITGVTGAVAPLLPVLDLRGDNANFSIVAGASTIDLTNTGVLNVEMGTEPKVLWDFRSTNTTATTININTTIAAITHTFHDVSFADNATVNVNGLANKTYHKITFGNNTTSTFNGNSTVMTTTDFGTGTQTTFNNSNVFHGAVQVVSTSNVANAATFNNSNFKSTLSFTSTTERAGTRFNNNCLFEGAVSYANPNAVMLLNHDNIFTATAPLDFLPTASNSNVSGAGDNLFGSTVTFAGNTNNYSLVGNNNYDGAVTFSGSANTALFGGANSVSLFRDVVNFSGNGNDVTFNGTGTGYTMFGKTLNIAAPTTAPEVLFLGRTFYRGNVTIGNGNTTLLNANIILSGVHDFINAPPAPPAFMPPLTAAETASAPAATLYDIGRDNRVEMQGLGSGSFRDFRLGINCTFQSFNTDDHIFDNITFSSYNYVELAARPLPSSAIPRFIINNNIYASVTCAAWINISSTITGVPTGIEFRGPAQIWNNVILQDLTITNTGAAPNPVVTASSSEDGGGNATVGTTIVFIGTGSGPGLYWVGGTGDWSDPNHWSTTPAPSVAPYGYPSGNTCIPTPGDDVYFTEYSFPSGGTCTVDIFTAYCKNMTWEPNVNPAARFAGTIDKRLQVFGNMILPDNFNVNTFLGVVEFQGNNIVTSNTIKSGAGRFVGPVEFNSSNDTWTLQDDMNVDGNARGSITINYGKLISNSKNISLEGDWTINLPAAGLTQATFDCGNDPLNSKVTFDGDVTQNISVASAPGTACVECSCSSSPFFNLVVNKTVNNPILHINNYSITVNYNFDVMVGDVRDQGNQIRGNNAGGELRLANNAFLRIGGQNVATVFPTCYPANKIILGAGTPAGSVVTYLGLATGANAAINSSVVIYRSRAQQLVSHLPVYGTLVMASHNGPAAAGPYQKDATGPLRIEGGLILTENTHLYDMGYQITGNSHSPAAFRNQVILQNGTALVLGTGTTAPSYTSTRPTGVPAPNALNRGIDNAFTAFPIFSPVGDTPAAGKMNLAANSTVVYNSSVAQPIQGGFSYGNLTLTATGAAALVDKTIVQGTAATGAITIKGDLTVNGFNNMVDDGWQITGDATKNMTVAGDAQLVIGNNTTSTQFPLNYIKANIDLNGNSTTKSTVIYYSGNAATGQIMSTVPNYGHVILRDPTPAPNTAADVITKTFQPVATVSIGGNLLIDKNNNLADGGSQIDVVDANTTSITMIDGNSFLTLGSATNATNFPMDFDTRDLQDNTTVIYTANVTQNVAGITGTPATTANSYANLIIQGDPVPAAQVVKNLQSPGATVRGNLIIRQRNTFNDRGFQIEGNSNAATSIVIEDRGVLRLGSTTTATVFPTFTPVGNAPAATPLPGAGKMDLHPGSRVEYISGAATQLVAGGFSYGTLLIDHPGSSTIVNKDLTATTTINGNFIIRSANRFRDMGFQVTGNTTTGNSMTMASNAELVLGQGASPTLFPNQFETINLNPNSLPRNTVIYNANVAGNNIAGQNTAGTSFQYANLELTSMDVVTKNLLHPVNVRGNLTINANNTLDVQSGGMDHNVTLGGDWLCYDKFMARTGQVELNGDGMQQLRTNAHPFYNLLINKPSSAVLMLSRAVMLDHCNITSNVNFQRGHFIPSGSALMIFGAAATVSGAYSEATAHPVTGEFGYAGFGNSQPGTESHVIGSVRKLGNADFVFPTGSGDDYAPLRLSDLSGDATTDFTVTYYPYIAPQPAYDVAQKEPALHHVGQMEYWDVVRGTTASSAKVTLTWNTPRSGGITYMPDMRVAHWPTGDAMWRDRGNEATTGTINKGTIRSMTVTTFSPFTPGSISGNNPLPVELLYFEAIPKAEQVELNWKTISEKENAFFTLERSTDGIHFTAFKTVPARRTAGGQVLPYQETDENPYRGLSYYRLKQTDLSGAATYSKIASVYLGSKDADEQMMVYPNPNQGSQFYVQLKGKDLTQAHLAILDALGREVYQRTLITEHSLIELQPAQKLASGTYTLKLITKDKVYTSSFVVD